MIARIPAIQKPPRRVAPPAPPLPDDVPANTRLYVDASRPDTITLINGNELDTWNDLGPLEKIVKAPNGGVPTYEPNGLNGGPCFRFADDGNPTVHRWPDFTPSESPAPGYTYWSAMVFELDVGAAGNTVYDLWVSRSGASSNYARGQMRIINGNLQFWKYNGSGSGHDQLPNFNYPVQQGVPYLLEMNLHADDDPNTNLYTYNIHLNGELIHQSDWEPGWGSYYQDGFYLWDVGSSGGQGGRVGMWIGVTSHYTQELKDRTRTHARETWGVTV